MRASDTASTAPDVSDLARSETKVAGATAWSGAPGWAATGLTEVEVVASGRVGLPVQPPTVAARTAADAARTTAARALLAAPRNVVMMHPTPVGPTRFPTTNKNTFY